MSNSPSSPLSDSVLRHLQRIASEPDLEGTPYELEARLGQGAMGAVYAVRDTRLHRRVALKVLHAGGPIEDEARIAASLEHPGIVPIHETGTLADGRSYYTMRRVEGSSLDAYLTNATPLSERLRVFQKICETVAFAHSRGVLHRDLKPGNIMTGPFGEVLILDWGIARLAAEPGRPGVVAGTPHFMAPEIAAGQGHLADRRADIYSLGALLDFCLPPAGGGPRALRAVAAKARSEEAGDRYADAAELNREIGRYLDGEAVLAYRESPWEKSRRFAARNNTLLLLLAAYVAARFFLYFLPQG
jgi:eukaryotic-like serine/threonine-protein kinase